MNHQCHKCNFSFKVKTKPKPKSPQDLKSEAIDIGLGDSNREAALHKPRGKYLTACYNSWRSGRSFNHVSTILLGLTGSGKSSTIMHLLGIKLKTSTHQSDTRDTKEYIITEKAENLAVTDLSLVRTLVS